jgi:hypothetical protein
MLVPLDKVCNKMEDAFGLGVAARRVVYRMNRKRFGFRERWGVRSIPLRSSSLLHHILMYVVANTKVMTGWYDQVVIDSKHRFANTGRLS